MVKENGEDKRLVLCLDNINEVTKKRDGYNYVEMPIEIQKENYYGYMTDRKGTAQIHSINLYCYVNSFNLCHIKTALKAITKNSEVSIKAVLFNNSNIITDAGFTKHDFYLIVDEKSYLLETFVGPDNSVNPVQYSIVNN